MFKTVKFLAVVLVAALGGIAQAQQAKAIEVTANDQMKYSVTSIEAAPGQALEITLKNVGTIPKAAMGHNMVILKPGTDVTAFATAAMSHADKGYLPPEFADKVVAATQILGPNESETLKVALPEAGEYPFVCSFPGHALAGMKGVLTVK